MAEGQHVVATNRRARHDYAIQETFEAGIVLTGAEVKSLRAGRASLAEAYARVNAGELWLEGMHIPPYEQGGGSRAEYEAKRPRKLLAHRKEIDRLVGKINEQRLALIPLRLYFKRGIAKVELGLGKGKKQYEKRRSIADREHQREMERGLAQRRRS